MKVRMITAETREKFKGMILPEVVADMEAGLPVTAIGLADDKTPVGAIAGNLENEHVFLVRSLYVSPAHRRKGGATMLVTALQKLLDTRDALALISYIEEDDEESQALTEFIESRECVLENGLERLYRGTVADFMRSGLFAGTYKSRDIHPLAGLDKETLTGIKRKARKSFGFLKERSLKQYKSDMDLSFAAMKSGELQGMLLTRYSDHHPKEPVIVLSDVTDPHTAGGLLNTFLNVCRDKLGENTYIRFPVADERFDRMMEAIDGVKNIPHNYLF